MRAFTSNQGHLENKATGVLIPLIRAAATIGFAVAPCSLGFVIIAVSEHLIRSIMVGDDPEMLMSDLQNQFPADNFEVAEKDAGLMRKVVELIERPDQPAELPLDVRGTEFQMSVWEALQTVPAGATVSYASLAKQIGSPNGRIALLRVLQNNAASPIIDNAPFFDLFERSKAPGTDEIIVEAAIADARRLN